MKNHRLLTDALREIKKTRSRFLSLFLLSALAVAFLAGLRTTAPDMEYTADAYYDAQHLMDLRVLSTLGLTQEDVDVLAAREGVALAEGAYTADAIVHLSDNDLIVKLLSLSEKGVNLPQLLTGRLPENAGECLVEEDLLTRSGLHLGDQLTFDTGTGTYEDALVQNTFTIAGTVNSPLYLSFDRGSSSLGAGRVSAFAILPLDAFQMECFTDAYLLAEGAEELLCYGEEYDALIDSLTQTLEPLSEERAALRYDEVILQAEEALQEAEQEFSDAQERVDRELADAWEELEDGRRELDDGWKEWQEGTQTLEREERDALALIADAEASLPDALEQLRQGEADYQAGAEALADGRAAYQEGLETYQDGLARYEDGAAQLSQGRQALDEARQQLSEARQQLEEGEEDYREGLLRLSEARQQLDEAQKQLDEGEALLAASAQELNEAQALYDMARTAYDAQLQALQDLLARIDPSLTPDSSDAEIAQALDRWLDESLTEETAQQALDSLRSWVYSLPPETLDRLPPELLEQLDALTPEDLLLAKEQVKQQTLALVAQARQAEQEAGLQLEAMALQLESAQAQFNGAADRLVDARQQLGEGKQLYEDSLRKAEEGRAQLDDGWRQLEEGQAEIDRSQALLEESEAELADAWEQLEDGRAELADALLTITDGEAELARAREDLDEGWRQYYDGLQQLADAKESLPGQLSDGRQQLADARQQLEDGEAEYRDGLARYEEGKATAQEELSDARRQLNDARRAVREIENCRWYVLSRGTNMGYVSYQQDAQRMGNLASVFPLIFFLVAALVCLTTMTRMVEERRVEIGGLKALGYGKWSISLKYVGYGFLASFLGGVAGLLVGCTLFPWIIFNAWKILYTVGELMIPIYPGISLLALGAAILCVTGTAFATCFATLTAVPAQLMRPRAPKPGKRVLLEHIPFLWKRLSFTWKVTVRNLFRYKKRFIMTVVGIGGCTALLITGFGLRNSIYDILDKQFDEISPYTSQIALASDVTDEEMAEIDLELSSSPHVLSWMAVSNASHTVEGPQRSVDAYLFAVDDPQTFSDFICLRHRLDEEPVTFPQEGVILTEKLADMLGVGPGDTITISGDKRVEATVVDLTENYVFHYIYLSSDYYRQLYGSLPQKNMILAWYDSSEQAVSDQVSTALISLSGVASVTRILDNRQTFAHSMESVDYAVILIVVCAAALAFVVLYNLTNINITERLRELATLKVLGFYDRELSSYVYRENIFLTLFGVLLGLVMGKYLHQYLVLTVEIDLVMFGRNVRPESYLYSVLLTVLFSLLVNLAARGRLKKIDMVESLKTVE